MMQDWQQPSTRPTREGHRAKVHYRIDHCHVRQKPEKFPAAAIATTCYKLRLKLRFGVVHGAQLYDRRTCGPYRIQWMSIQSAPDPSQAQDDVNGGVGICARELLRQFVSRKKVTQLKPRRIVSVRTMYGVVLDAGRPFLSNGSFFSIRRIRRAHELTQIGDSVFFFQRQ